jgi:hypothetical protein
MPPLPEAFAPPFVNSSEFLDSEPHATAPGSNSASERISGAEANRIESMVTQARPEEARLAWDSSFHH